jgi:hypothetical protein
MRISVVRWLSGLVWIGSWRIVYLEVFRWQHLTRTLRFNRAPARPGLPAPKPGLPLQAVRIAAVAAPAVFVVTTVRQHRLTSTSHDLLLTFYKRVDSRR